jgi:hypothetical protein
VFLHSSNFKFLTSAVFPCAVISITEIFTLPSVFLRLMVILLRSITNVSYICQPVWPSSSVKIVLVRHLLFRFCGIIASGTLRLVTFCCTVCVRFILNKSQFVKGTEDKRRSGVDFRVP